MAERPTCFGRTGTMNESGRSEKEIAAKRPIGSNSGMDPIRIYDYLVLARGRVFDWVRPLTDAQYRLEHPVGLGSLARTLHHVKAAESSYMERIRGRTDPLGTPPPEDDPEVSTADALPFPRLEAAWIEQAVRTRADLEATPDWSTTRVYTTEWDGRPYSYRASAADIFAQLALHEVHHRAQVLQMLRRIGAETGEIDYNALMWAPDEQD